MAQNPLLGKRISLISKKNIRYEGLLYSINEQNATVALQNVKSFGTEGREKDDAETSFIAPSDAVHPYLLFRGQDIKDLHVHDETQQQEGGGTAAASSSKPAADDSNPPPLKPEASTATTTSTTTQPSSSKPEKKQPSTPKQQQQQGSGGGGGRSSGNRRPRKQQSPAVGTGASLLNRKARGVVEGDPQADATPKTDFDFQSHNDQFVKNNNNNDTNGHQHDEEDDDDEAGDEPAAPKSAYQKDDFFDSISCATLDKQSGIDNRLRGQQERHLNTETFGAVALNSRRRGRGGRGRGRGGRRGGRGGGRGSSGRGSNRRSYNNSGSWNRRNNNRNSSSNTASTTGQPAATASSS